MKILYIGQYSLGTTSKLRADTLGRLLPDANYQIIDTHIPFYNVSRFWRSIGFRFKKGPLVKRTNSFIVRSIIHEQYDFIWVDKAVYVTEQTTRVLKSKTNKLIHYTPDPAFTFHQSSLFFNSIKWYDVLITTKSFELSFFQKHANPNTTVLFLPQGIDYAYYNRNLAFDQKKAGIIFIGHYEISRGELIKHLITQNVHVSVAGNSWTKFVKKNQSNNFLHYLGKGIYGENYATELSKYQYSWGALSKWIPEKHTTRTFEIPATGTALITERNEETLGFFDEKEVIFYDSPQEIVDKLQYFKNNPNELNSLIRRGKEKLSTINVDYEKQLKDTLLKIGIV